MKNKVQLETYENYMTIAPIPEKVLETCKEISCEEALELGHRYFRGINVEQDYEKAVEYYRQAAEQGIADAYFALSICYRLGKGVKADPEQERILLEKANKNQRQNLYGRMGLEEQLDDLESAGKSKESEAVRCSFCYKPAEKVKKLIAANGVYICNECIDICAEILDEELSDEDKGGSSTRESEELLEDSNKAEEKLADSKAEENEKASMDLNPKKPENYLSPNCKKILFKGLLRVCSPRKVRKIIFSDSFASNIKKQYCQDISQKQDKSILGWAESSEKGYIVHIEAKGKIIAPEDCSSLFEGLNNVREIVFGSVFDTSNTHCMKNMFHECSSLESIDLSEFVTENVTDMSFMFHGCKNLKEINVNGLVTHNVTSMAGMFAECGSLESLDVSGFATQNVSGMDLMFYGCMSLKQLDVSKFVTANVTNMHGMFYDCVGLESLDVSGFSTENVLDMGFMFYNCGNLKHLDTSGFVTRKVTTMKAMFHNCESLKYIDVSGFDTENVTDMSYMFRGCTSLKYLDLSGFTTLNVNNMEVMFAVCSNLETLDVSGLDTQNVTNMYQMFRECVNLKTIDGEFSLQKVRDMREMFYGCKKLENLDISRFDAISADKTKKNNMFDGCDALQLKKG